MEPSEASSKLHKKLRWGWRSIRLALIGYVFLIIALPTTWAIRFLVLSLGAVMEGAALAAGIYSVRTGPGKIGIVSGLLGSAGWFLLQVLTWPRM